MFSQFSEIIEFDKGQRFARLEPAEQLIVPTIAAMNMILANSTCNAVQFARLESAEQLVLAAAT